MKIKPEAKLVNGQNVWHVRVPGSGGTLVFSSFEEAQEFCDYLNWLLRCHTGGVAWRMEEQALEPQGSGNPAPPLHSLIGGLACLSFALAAVGAVEHIHLSALRRILEVMEKARLEQDNLLEDLLADFRPMSGCDLKEGLARMRAARDRAAAETQPQKKITSDRPKM